MGANQHIELLDGLAVEFRMERAIDEDVLHRMIVTSNTYTIIG